MMMVSTLRVQKPPSPTVTLRLVRWWAMYSDGVMEFLGGHTLSFFSLARAAGLPTRHRIAITTAPGAAPAASTPDRAGKQRHEAHQRHGPLGCLRHDEDPKGLPGRRRRAVAPRENPQECEGACQGDRASGERRKGAFPPAEREACCSAASDQPGLHQNLTPAIENRGRRRRPWAWAR